MSGTNLDYIVHGPKQGPAKKLVILLHGYGRNAKYMDKVAREIMDHVPGAMIVSPHAPEVLKVPDQIDPVNGDVLHIPQEVQAGDDGNDPSMLRQWFAIDGGIDALKPRMVRTAQILNEFIDNQRDMLGLKDSDIALMGFSQGGGTALFTAYTRKNELACLVAHSCIFFDDASMASKPETFFLYGDADREFSKSLYRRAFDAVSKYTKGRATERVVPGLGHYTNAASRRECADFIRRHLSP